MKSLCVFCGSSKGNNPNFLAMAHELADQIVNERLALVYGGASVGLMAEVADRVLKRGGEVQGVIPCALFSKEIPHQNLTKLHVTDTMHERKKLMYDLSDGFVALPGGLGTLDELCEVLSWAQLGLHEKPIGVLNVEGYFDPLIKFLNQAVENHFMRPKHRNLLIVEKSPEALLRQFQNYHPTIMKKWISKNEL